VVIETPVMMEVAEVAARPGKMPTRKAATESAADVSATESAADVSATESAAHVTATESPAHVTATETATHVTATESPAHVTATETATHVTATESATVSATYPAPRKRVRAQRACESGSYSQNDHGFT
jgi:hypothetical protein